MYPDKPQVLVKTVFPGFYRKIHRKINVPVLLFWVFYFF